MSTLQTIFCGGCSDSAYPRKVHLYDEKTERPLCGQHIPHVELIECSDIEEADYVGNDACAKCLRIKALPPRTYRSKQRGG